MTDRYEPDDCHIFEDRLGDFNDEPDYGLVNDTSDDAAYIEEADVEPDAPEVSYMPDQPLFANMPPIENWDVVPYTDLADAELKPYQIVDGVLSLRGFNTVENSACATVSPVQGNTGEIMAREGEIVSRRVENILRPADFGGALLAGQALILPFDPETAIGHDARMSKILTPTRLAQRLPEGLTVVYSGLFKSSYSGVLGRLCVHTTYFAQKNIRYARQDGRDYVKRTVGNTESVHNASEAVARNTYESANRALQSLKRSLSAPKLGRQRFWVPEPFSARQKAS